MWRYMESNDPATFVHSYEEGVERVLRGNFAFLCESTMLDYLVKRNCNLTQIGGLLDNKGYGIATPKGSKWKDKISQAVLFLHVSSSSMIPLANLQHDRQKRIVLFRMVFQKWEHTDRRTDRRRDVRTYGRTDDL